jgi:hypothetical protein
MSKIVRAAMAAFWALALTALILYPGPALAAGLAQDVGALQAAVSALQAQVSTLQAQISTAKGTISSLQSDLAAVQANPALGLGPYVSVDTTTINGLNGPHILFTGANVHIRSGSGATDDGSSLTGLGNLVIGYDESPGILSSGDRGGSHNLIIGPANKYLSYGGLVAGDHNSISGPSASVSGGYFNVASGQYASISGGSNNAGSGTFSSVSGGFDNTASDIWDNISGGYINTASGEASSVSGGYFNTASGDESSISGGSSRSVTAQYNWAAGSLVEPN